MQQFWDLAATHKRTSLEPLVCRYASSQLGLAQSNFLVVLRAENRPFAARERLYNNGANARPRRAPAAQAQAVDYAAVNEGVEKVGLASRWIPHLERTKDEFLDGAALGVARLATGSDLNDAWARKTDMRTPAIIASTEGLGMTLPEPHFMVRDVAKVIGEEKPVQVMRSRDQTNLDHWSLGDWSRYYDAPRRQEVLNVISLEFSRTALAGQVISPEFVRKRDWIDTAWPANLRAQGHWPQVQYYCLMSTAGCYTDFHVDFGGTAVWYHVFRGQKVFYLIKPTPENLKAYEAWICDAKQDSTFFPDTIGGPTECARVEINAGQDVLHTERLAPRRADARRLARLRGQLPAGPGYRGPAARRARHRKADARQEGVHVPLVRALPVLRARSSVGPAQDDGGGLAARYARRLNGARGQ